MSKKGRVLSSLGPSSCPLFTQVIHGPCRATPKP
jgi:hypothetical protein